MVKAQTPTIAQIKNATSETDVRALISLAICEVCDFFNVGKNMNDTQIALTADLIMESFWYFKLEEIKYCFRYAMRNEKLFDRLDGNVILGWLKNYDAERTEEVMRISDQEASQEANEIKIDPNAKTFEEYVESLKQRVADGDGQAKGLLANIENPPPVKGRYLTPEERHQKELDYFKWYNQEYLKKK